MKTASEPYCPLNDVRTFATLAPLRVSGTAGRLLLALLLGIGLSLPAGCVPMDATGAGDTNLPGDGGDDTGGGADGPGPGDGGGDGTGGDGTGGGAGTTTAQLIEDCTGNFDTSEFDFTAEFQVDGPVLIMRGVYEDTTTDTMLALLDANPDVRTLVLAWVGGADVSMDGNLVGGVEVRNRGLNTCVPAGGLVASGGTDFFLAGENRIVLEGAQVGVHSWEESDDQGNTETGDQVPRNDPRHQPFLEFYEAVGIPADFYWFTLEAAPASGMYYMTFDEMLQFGMIEEDVR